jgi:hypothetical protein
MENYETIERAVVMKKLQLEILKGKAQEGD